MARSRLDWLDLARGAALTGVVYHHVIAVVGVGSAHPSGPILPADLVLDGFRMPTLVMVSGLLATGVRGWSWPEVLRRRVLPLILMYVLWGVIGSVITAAVSTGGSIAHALAADALMLFRPDGVVWYLYALAIYIALARALRRVPSVPLVIAAAVAFLLSMAWLAHADLPQHFHYWYYVGEHWIFFVCAERGARFYHQAAAHSSPGAAMGAVAVFAGVGWGAVALDIVRNPVVLLVLCALGTVMAVVVCAAFAGARVFAWARAIGRHSLGVYVTHSWVIVLLWTALGSRVPSFRLHNAVLSVVMLAAALAIAYGLTRALERFAPVPLLRPWWSTRARDERPAEHAGASHAP